MGSGGMIVIDQDSCMVDIAKFSLNFTAKRILRQMHTLPGKVQSECSIYSIKITEGNGEMYDIENLERLGQYD